MPPKAPEEKPVAPAEVPAEAEPSPEQEVILDLLDQAYEAFRRSRLTTPFDDNAYYRYLRVLALDPGNERAEQGIADIVEQYLAWATERAHAGEMSAATGFVQSAASIDPEHPNIPAVYQLIEDRRSARRERHQVSPAKLDARAADLVAELVKIGKAASAKQALVVITARTDAEGRWIYQQLNSATDTRVRARFELGSTPNVQVWHNP